MSQTPAVTIRPMTIADAPAFYRWRQEKTTQRFNPLENLTLETLRQRLELEIGDLSERRQSQFRWVIERGHEAVGSLALKDINWRMGYGEIGYAVTERLHGKGIATAAVEVLVEMIFKTTELRRILAYISVENASSWRLVERLGFVREGCLRQHFVIQGRPVDEYVYGLLRSDWDQRSATAASRL